MKFDKEMVIAFLLCGLLLVFWQPLCVKLGWMPDPAAAVGQAAEAAQAVVQPVQTPVSSSESAAKAAEPVVPVGKVLPAVMLVRLPILL